MDIQVIFFIVGGTGLAALSGCMVYQIPSMLTSRKKHTSEKFLSYLQARLRTVQKKAEHEGVRQYIKAKVASETNSIERLINLQKRFLFEKPNPLLLNQTHKLKGVTKILDNLEVYLDGDIAAAEGRIPALSKELLGKHNH